MITKISHLTLFVNDQDKAMDFYTKKLGFKVHTDAKFGELRWLTLHPEKQPDFELVLMLAQSDEEKALVGKQAASKPLITLETDDCTAEYNKLNSQGVKFLSAPTKEPWGIGAIFSDLYGNQIYLVQV